MTGTVGHRPVVYVYVYPRARLHMAVDRHET